MRGALLVPVLCLLAGCDRSGRTAPSGPAASTPASAETAQTSIIRPEIAATATPSAPLQPLQIVVDFPAGGAELGPEQVEKLAQLVASAQANQGGPIRLGGHSDSSGSDAANLAASQARGEAVRDWLIAHGIAAQRIGIVAFGEQNPLRPNALPDGTPNERGRAANRRVEISVPVAAPAPSAEPREQTLAEEIVENAKADAARGSEPDNND